MTPTNEADVALAESSSAAGDTARSGVEVSISIRTLLLVAGAVAIASALASIANVLLVIFVSIFDVAVLSPVVTAMERRLGWSRGRCSTVLVLGILIAHRRRRAGAGAGDQRRSARIQRRPATDRGQGQAQRSGQLRQRRERLARHVEGARGRHHQRGWARRRAASSMSESPPSGRSRSSSRSSS